MCEFERLNEISKNAWNAKQPANAWNPLTDTINATIPIGTCIRTFLVVVLTITCCINVFERLHVLHFVIHM